MTRGSSALVGLCLGAGLMYLADPSAGRRRRGRLRDTTWHRLSTLRAAAITTSRDVQNRTAGLIARGRGVAVHHDAPSDGVLAARVRARLGRVVSHPRAIEVAAAGGIVTLRGQVFEGEVARLLSEVASVPGVARVEHELHPHPRAEGVPALQGVGPRKPASAVARSRWTPSARLLAGAAGAGLVAYAARRRTIAGAATELAGLRLIDRAVTGA